MHYHKLFSVVSGRMRPHTAQNVKAWNKPGVFQITAVKLTNSCRNGLEKNLSSVPLIISTWWHVLTWWVKPSPLVPKILSSNSSSEGTLCDCSLPVNWVTHLDTFRRESEMWADTETPVSFSLGQNLSRLSIHCAFRVADYSVGFIALLICSRHHLSLLQELRALSGFFCLLFISSYLILYL